MIPSISYLDPVEQGATLTEKAVDVHVVDGVEFIARWYHSPFDSDLMMWFDADGVVARFQLNSAGQILDWTKAEGLQTGFIVELEVKEGDDAAETIRFDADLNSGTLKTSAVILTNCANLSPRVRQFALDCLEAPQSSVRVSRSGTSRTRFWGRFKRWTTGA